MIGVKGNVVLRPEGTANPKLATGEIEVIAKDLKILNVSKTPPFLIEDEEEVAENTRLKYRYLDLRRPRLATESDASTSGGKRGTKLL